MILAVSKAIMVVILFGSVTYAWTSSTNSKTTKDTGEIVSYSLSPTNLPANQRMKQPNFLNFIFEKISEFVWGKTKSYEIDHTDRVGDTPIFRLHINEKFELAPKSTDRLKELINWTRQNNITDLWVVSHGWLTTAGDAFSVNYEPLFKEFDQLLQKTDYQQKLKGKKFGVVGITWNSLTEKAQEKWDEVIESELPPQEPPEGLQRRMFRSVEGTNVENVNEEIKMESDTTSGDSDDLGSVHNFYEEGNEAFFLSEQTQAKAELVQELKSMFGDAEDLAMVESWLMEGSETNQPMGQFDGEIQPMAYFVPVVQLPALRTFLFMKGRAAQSGIKVLSNTLGSLRQSDPKLRIHLVGHSFGALLVSATASRGKRGDYASLTLLQGAFSKNSFVSSILYDDKPGMFHNITKDEIVKGPITVTHTLNDKALSRVYRVAGFTFRGHEFRGVEVPNFRSNPEESTAKVESTKVKVGSSENKPFRAIGDEGIAGVDDLTVKWNSIEEFNPISHKDKKFHSIHAKNEVKNHSDVWNKHIAVLLTKVAQASN